MDLLQPDLRALNVVEVPAVLDRLNQVLRTFEACVTRLRTNGE